MKGERFPLLFISLFLVVFIVACGGPQTSELPAVTPPAINLEITGDLCPSIEAQVGMHVAWTNRDDVDHILLLERVDESGALIDSGGTDLLQPGSTFSMNFPEPGEYRYYCSEDRTSFGTITVLP